jgi:metal-responsive CopG/Arc/MetJ family transcriptional regulator
MGTQPYRKLSISLPESLAVQVEKAAEEESSTVSELMRQAFRSYRAQQVKQRLEAGHAYARERNIHNHQETDVSRLVEETREESDNKRTSF